VRIQEEHGSQATSYMRWSVFEQIGQNQARSRSQDAGPVVPDFVPKSSGQRGPKKRPIYRLWEYATWRIRMRAWCNQIKAALLREDHDPDQPQTYRVIQAASCPIDSQSTWLSWWEGEAIPRPSHITAAERLSPDSGELLDLAEMRTCLSRHLFALDVLNTKFRVSDRPVDYRRAQTARLLAGLNEGWISFLDTSAPPKSSRHNVLNQTGHSADALLDAVEIPPEWVAFGQRFGDNRARWALPPYALFEHNWLEPTSIFRFLAMLAGSGCLIHPKLIELWAIDLASATLAVRSLIETAGLRRPRFSVIRMGFAGGMFQLATVAFFAPRDLLDQPETLSLAQKVYGDSYGDGAEAAVQDLRKARDVYYNVFAVVGIQEAALRGLNGTHWEKTWDGAFSAARARL
jgi:hypothetical protein